MQYIDSKISQILTNVKHGTVSSILLYKMNVVVLPRYTINPSSPGKGHKPKPHTVQAHICFDNVRFAYPTRPSQWALDSFSLKTEGGTTVAIVGPSGSGKSTVVGPIVGT